MTDKASQSTVDAKTEVLVVAIHNDILTRYQEILKKTEIKSWKHISVKPVHGIHSRAHISVHAIFH